MGGGAVKVGQKIDDFIDDFEFEIYQNDETKKVKFSNYDGKWLVLLFYPADFTFICPTELQEAAEYYDEFKKKGAEILSVGTDTVFAHKAWHDHSPSIAKIAIPWSPIRRRGFAAILELTLRIPGCPCGELLSSILTAFSKRWTFTTTASAEARKKFSASSRQRVLCASIKAKSVRRVGNQARKRSSRGWTWWGKSRSQSWHETAQHIRRES